MPDCVQPAAPRELRAARLAGLRRAIAPAFAVLTTIVAVLGPGALRAAAAGPDDLAIALTASALHHGQSGTYTITVSNSGPMATGGPTTVTDWLPGGLTVVSAGGAGWSCKTGKPLTCASSAAIAAGAAYPAIKLTAGVAAAAGRNVTNTAAVSNRDDPNVANNTVSVTTAVAGPIARDTGVTISSNGPYRFGADFTMKVAVHNYGSAATSGAVTFTDPLPSSLSFVSAVGSGWSCAFATGNQVVCESTRAVSSGGTFPSLSITLSPTAGGSLTDAVTVASAGDQNAANNSATWSESVDSPDLSLSLSGPAQPIVAAEAATFTATVTQSGLPTTGTTTLSLSAPAGVTLAAVSSSPAIWLCASQASGLTCSTTASIDGAVDLTLTATPGPAVNPVFTPTITVMGAVSTPGDSNTANDATSATDSVIAQPIGKAAVTNGASLSGHTVISPTVTCNGVAGAVSCNITGTVSGFETLRGKRVVAVSATRPRLHGQDSRGLRVVAVTLGTAKAFLPVGHGQTPLVALNAAARTALAALHKASAELVLRQTPPGPSAAVVLIRRYVALR